MEIIELTSENIDTYLQECVALQSHLVSTPSTINPELFQASAEDSHSYFLALVTEGQVCGLGLVSKIVHPANITGYVNNIVVHPDARQKGYFGLIMDTLEEKARQWGCRELVLTCSREAVWRKYEKRGYLKKDTNFYRLNV